MPTDTKPFYRHILGTHWKDKPNKGLDVKVKKKVSNFLRKPSGQPQSRSCKPEFWHWQRWNFPERCIVFSREQVCGGSFTVHGCSRQRLQLTHRYCIAACGTPNTTDRCQEKNQRPGISAPIPMRGGKKRPERFKHTCSRIVQRFDMHPMATAVTRRFKHRRKLRWRGYTFARNRWRRQSEELLHYAR